MYYFVASRGTRREFASIGDLAGPKRQQQAFGTTRTRLPLLSRVITVTRSNDVASRR